MKEIIDKFLLTYRLEREQRRFQRELKDAFAEKKKNPLLVYLFLLFPLFGAGALWYYYDDIVETPSQQITSEETRPVEIVVPVKPELETVIKAEEEAPPEETAPTIEPEPEQIIPDVPQVEIRADKALIYSVENELGEVIASLEKGSVLELIDETGDWRKVRYGDRKIGWIKAGAVQGVSGKTLETIFSEKIAIEEKPTLLLVKEFLEEWVSRTESRDVESYIQLYDDEFTGQGRDKAAWKERKGRIFQNARFILVGVKSIVVLEETDSTLKVAFVQYYNNSDSLKTTNNKVMILRKTENGYRILREYLQ